MDNCPHCHSPIELVAPKQKRWTVPGILDGLFAPRRFDYTVTPRQANPYQVDPGGNIIGGEVQPGEERERTINRPKTVADLAPSFWWSITIGGFVSGVAWSLGTGAQGIIGIWCGTSGVSFLVASFPVVWLKEGGASVLAMMERITRHDIDGDGQVGDPPRDPILLDLTTKTSDTSGSKRTQRLTIPCPAAGEEALARWFWRVVRENGDRFSIRVARTYDIMRQEANDIQEYFVENSLAEKVANKYAPTDEGINTMWAVVKRHIPDATRPPRDSVCEA